jgi:hypothetical protein
MRSGGIFLDKIGREAVCCEPATRGGRRDRSRGVAIDRRRGMSILGFQVFI